VVTQHASQGGISTYTFTCFTSPKLLCIDWDRLPELDFSFLASVCSHFAKLTNIALHQLRSPADHIRILNHAPPRDSNATVTWCFARRKGLDAAFCSGTSTKRDMGFCMFPLKANGYQPRRVTTPRVQVKAGMKDYALPFVGGLGGVCTLKIMKPTGVVVCNDIFQGTPVPTLSVIHFSVTPAGSPSLRPQRARPAGERDWLAKRPREENIDPHVLVTWVKEICSVGRRG
jgi:hypothetical protein